ncbi:MAG: iron-containing alcohol dehydrogenase [Spirochaetota bacterium]
MEMNSFTFSGIPRIVFGAGSFSGLNKIVRSYGRNVLIITGGESLKKSGRLDSLAASLTADKIKIEYCSVSGEPTPEIIDRAAREFRKKPINAVIGIGGGSVIDAGKAVSAMLGEEGSISDYLEGIGTKRLSGVKAPFIAVPTTSGTGSEATKNAVISSVGEQGFKKSLRHDNYVPDEVLIDPELMISCPPDITAACGMDTLSQLLEAFIAVNANPMTDALALSGIRYFHQGYLRAYAQADDIEARSSMAYASLMSGITLAQAGLGTVHGIAGPMGGFFHIPHGTACGTLLGEVMHAVCSRLSAEKSPVLSKCAAAGQLFCSEQGKSDEYYSGFLCETIDSLIEKTAIPRLSVFGIHAEDCVKIADFSDNKASPAVLSRDEIKDILLRRL